MEHKLRIDVHYLLSYGVLCHHGNFVNDVSYVNKFTNIVMVDRILDESHGNYLKHGYESSVSFAS